MIPFVAISISDGVGTVQIDSRCFILDIIYEYTYTDCKDERSNMEATTRRYCDLYELFKLYYLDHFLQSDHQHSSHPTS